MDYVKLGRSALKVSPLCLGTMNFGPETSEPDSYAVMDRAHELGINFFDTANVYGWKKGEGVTEQIVGRWFAQGGGRREKTVIATKLYGDMGDWPNESRVSALSIRRQCDASSEASADRLHRRLPDAPHRPQRPLGRGVPGVRCTGAAGQGAVLRQLELRGVVYRSSERSCQAQRHFLGLVSEQCIYNLSTRDVETDVLPACEYYGLGRYSHGARLGGGLLGGALQKASEGRRASERVQKQIEEHRPQLERYEALCAEIGREAGGRGLWPGFSATPWSPRRLSARARWSSWTARLKALEVTITADLKAKLDEIFPGHKTAPEDFRLVKSAPSATARGARITPASDICLWPGRSCVWTMCRHSAGDGDCKQLHIGVGRQRDRARACGQVDLVVAEDARRRCVHHALVQAGRGS